VHEEAARLAGEVFGKILNREADRGGYEYVLYCLEGGIKPVQQIILDFIASDEFIDRFVAGRDPGEVAALVTKILLGGPPKDESQVAGKRYHLVRFGLRAFAEEIMLSQQYQQATGPDAVPGEGH
jgi:hypothetical protein